MIDWIKIETGAAMPSDGEELIFWARGSARCGTYYAPTGGFDETNTGLCWHYPKVSHWSPANEPDGN